MKKLISLVSLLLCILMVFASCGASESGMKLNKKALSFSTAKTNYKLTEITELEGFKLAQTYAFLTVFTKQNTEAASTEYKVLNLKTSTVVLTKTYSNESILNGNAKITLLENNSLFFTVFENGTHTLYKSDGIVIGSAKTAPIFINSCIVIGETVCRFDLSNFEVKEIFTYNALNGEIPECIGLPESGYLYSRATNGFKVYDSHFKFIGDYTFPSYAEKTSFFPLNNGTALLQYLIPLPYDTAEYDILIDSQKYDLVQTIFSPENFSEKETEVGYFINDSIPLTKEDANELFKKKIVNQARGYKIENYQYDTNNEVYLSLNNKCEATPIYNSEYSRYSPIGNGYFTAITKTKEEYILDKKLNPIVNVDSLLYYNEKYLVTTTAIYDYNLTKLADLVTDTFTYTLITYIGQDILFYAPDENGNPDYFIFDGAFTKISDYSEGQRLIYNLGCVAYAVETITGEVTTTKLYKSDKTELAVYTDKFVNLFAVYGAELSEVMFSVGNKIYQLTATK